jgi:hypothetical protein
MISNITNNLYSFRCPLIERMNAHYFKQIIFKHLNYKISRKNDLRLLQNQEYLFLIKI